MSMQFRHRLAPIAAVLAATSHACAQPILHPVFRTVTTCVDDAQESGSLRAALMGVSASDSLFVDLSTLTCSRISLASGALVDGAESVTLNGPTNQVLTIDGNNVDRVFAHYGHGTMTVNHLTLTDGRYTSGPRGGGAIYSAGSVLLDHATVSSSHVYNASLLGGGVYSLGDVTLSYSTVTGNQATFALTGGGGSGRGGGIYAKQSFHAYSSTISNNFAGDSGGGISTGGYALLVGTSVFGNGAYQGAAISGGGMQVRNSTIAGNETDVNPEFGNSGSVIQSANLFLYNSTIAGNTCLAESGAIVNADTLKMVSSIVADNTNYAGCSLISPVAIVGNNNIVDGTGFGSLPGDTIKRDPQLQQLADNGGPTLTMALAPTSPAIDAGDNPLGLTTDQRGAGFARVVGTAPDIGAFESNEDIFANGFE